MVVEETISYININGNEHPIDACSIDGKNDEYFQESGKLVNHISSSSTDEEYPSAKCLYDMIWGIGGEHKDNPSYDYSKDYLTFEAVDDGTFSFSRNVIQYSVDDGNTWVDLPANTNTPTVSSGNKIMFKKTNPAIYTYYGIGTFSSTGRFNTYGNIMSLLYGDDFYGQTSLSEKSYVFRRIFMGCSKMLNISNLILPATTLSNYCYAYMFQGCTGLITATSLPATTLTTYCYFAMFDGCTGLMTAPELPATTLADNCYSYMFSGCKNLTTAPILSAITMCKYCYQDMFYGCTSLVTAPELPATTLDMYCYQDMFVGCTNLTTAPELPIMTLAYGCYSGMFRNCINLTTAPVLPATQMNQYCYQEMFYGCRNLMTAPILPATSLAYGCYMGMFQGCRSLTETPILPATTLATCCYQNMFYGCTGITSTPVLPATIMMGNCYDSMFSGCTGITSTPVLSATRLATSCYRSMFYGCTSLISTTSLPATNLKSYCYQNMFYGCTSLVTAPELPATTLMDYCYDSMFRGCTSLTTAPVLSAGTLEYHCYSYMFFGCRNLNYIECYAIDNIVGTSNLTDWVYGVSSRGTFVGNRDASWIISDNGIPVNWTYNNVNVIHEYQSSNRYGMYVDDFNDVEMSNETIDYNGETYYVWTRKNIDDNTAVVRYALTETNDYNTLYNLSLESDLDNLTQHPVSYFFSDIDTPYTSGENQTLIKIEDNDGYMSMWVDDFYYNNVASFIADPISNDCNAFEYTGEDITYDGDDYYVWKNMGFMRSNGTDGSYNRTYVLTDTINQNILQQKSLEYSTSNLTEKPIVAFLDADSREYENGNGYSIISLRNTTGLEMWIDKNFDHGWDDGGYGDMEEYLDWYLSDVNRGGGKHYYYIDTFEYNGDTCYIWYNYVDKTYVVTETINISTLTSYSIESNYSNVNTHPLIIFLDKDFEAYDSRRDASEYSIVKVTSSQPSMMIWVDEFMKDDFDFNDIIDDPAYSGANEYVCGLLDIGDNLLDLDDPGSVGANYYEYCEPFEYNGETYYIWVYSYDGYNDYSYDNMFNMKYLLTDTIDFNTLRSYSLEYDMSNLSTYPIVAYLGLDLSTTYEHDDRNDNIVKVFRI